MKNASVGIVTVLAYLQEPVLTPADIADYNLVYR